MIQQHGLRSEPVKTLHCLFLHRILKDCWNVELLYKGGGKLVLESNELNLLWVKDGVNSYTWVKYSKIYPPTAQSITDNSTDAVYIGIAYNKTTI